MDNDQKTGAFIPFIALFDPKKRDIKNKSYNAHFTPKNVRIALFSVIILNVYCLIPIS